MAIIGLDFYGVNVFKSNSPPVRDLSRVQLSNGIFDEIHFRSKTSEIDTSSIKKEWQVDTKLLAKFTGDLEAGNINNNGIQIEKFAIKRRSVDDLDSLLIDYAPFENNKEFQYVDFTQPSDNLIYSIIPVGTNGLEGEPNDISISSDFAGWFVVDKITKSVLPFDTFIGSEPNVSLRLNQGKVQIDTLTKYPSFFYTDQEYHTFSLQALFLTDDWKSTGDRYVNILETFIKTHNPFLVKSGNGELYICNIDDIQKDSPLNTTRNYRDFINLTINLTEVMDYEEYIEEM